MQVCEKVKSKPKKIFDAVNKLWKKESDIEKPAPAPKTPKVKRRPLKPEDTYKTCDFCGRKFCENAFDRHVEFCKEKNNRITSSPVKDVVAQAKLIARTKYNPKEESKKSELEISSQQPKYTKLLTNKVVEIFIIFELDGARPAWVDIDNLSAYFCRRPQVELEPNKKRKFK